MDSTGKCYQGQCNQCAVELIDGECPDKVECSNKGFCTLLGDTMQCSCNPNHTGVFCEKCVTGTAKTPAGNCVVSTCVSSSVAIDCSGQGECTLNNEVNQFACECNAHHEG